jgi:ribosome-binding protein aMBF1 (putative translation factor)
MGKRNVVVYLEDNLVQIAKGMGINLSQLFNDTLRIAVEMPETPESELTSDLNEAIEKTRTEIGIKKQELASLMSKHKEIEKEKEKKKPKVLFRERLEF